MKIKAKTMKVSVSIIENNITVGWEPNHTFWPSTLRVEGLGEEEVDVEETPERGWRVTKLVASPTTVKGKTLVVCRPHSSLRGKVIRVLKKETLETVEYVLEDVQGEGAWNSLISNEDEIIVRFPDEARVTSSLGRFNFREYDIVRERTMNRFQQITSVIWDEEKRIDILKEEALRIQAARPEMGPRPKALTFSPFMTLSG